MYTAWIPPVPGLRHSVCAGLAPDPLVSPVAGLGTHAHEACSLTSVAGTQTLLDMHTRAQAHTLWILPVTGLSLCGGWPQGCIMQMGLLDSQSRPTALILANSRASLVVSLDLLVLLAGIPQTLVSSG